MCVCIYVYIYIYIYIFLSLSLCITWSQLDDSARRRAKRNVDFRITSSKNNIEQK